jgi:hypothetical protein
MIWDMGKRETNEHPSKKGKSFWFIPLWILLGNMGKVYRK